MSGTAAPPRRARGSFLATAISLGSVLAGNGLYVVLGFLATWLTAARLTPAEFGVLSMALAIMVVLQEVCGGGIDLAMVRLANQAESPARAANIFRAALHVKLAINGGVSLLLLMLADAVSLRIYANGDLAPLLRTASAGLFAAAFYNYVLARLQADEKFVLYAVYRGLNNACRLGLLILLLWLGLFDPGHVMMAWSAAFVVCLACGIAFHRPGRSPEAIEPGTWRDVLRFGQWIMASHLLFAMQARTDILLLGHYVSPDEVGLYSNAWNITFIIDLCTYSLITVLLPQAARLTGGQGFRRYLGRAFLFSVAVSVLIAPIYLFAGPFIGLLYPGYGGSVPLLRILFWGAWITLLVHPLALILYARDRVRLLTLVDLILLIAAAVGGFLVIPGSTAVSGGATGAALVTVGVRVLSCVLIGALVYREMRAVSRSQGPE